MATAVGRKVLIKNRWGIMIKEILIDTKSDQTRAAFLEDGELVELHIELNEKEKHLGNIYRGKVDRVLPGMQCGFIDIGTGKNAYLSADDVLQVNRNDNNRGSLKIENAIRQGQELTVQVIKDIIGTKAAKVTTNISLPGNLTVLFPLSAGVGISKKIDNDMERKRLKDIAEELCPEGMGLVIRTVAEGVEPQLIENDIKYILQIWEEVKRKEQKGNVPRCLYKEPNLVQRLARDSVNSDIKRFILSDRKEFEDLLGLFEEIAPEMKARVKFFCKDYDLFSFYNVESAIKEALSKKVWLKSGGYLVFDYTEALTVIDVNTGRYVGKNNEEDTMLKTNLEAIQMIARQIRLRDIGGIILVDFIDMKERTNKEAVITSLIQACKNDRTRVVVVGMTGLGLVEMTRKKIRNTLNQILTHQCPMCGGNGRVETKNS